MTIKGQGDFCNVNEHASNKFLGDILAEEDKDKSPDVWDAIKKAISIFGIAAGMLFV